MGNLCTSSEVDPPRVSRRSLASFLPPRELPRLKLALLPSLERTIQVHERISPFASLSVDSFAKKLLQEGMENKLSLFQVRTVFKKLGLSKSLLEDRDSSFYQFMVSMREAKLYNLSKLLLAGLLLASGRLSDKAKCLFDHFDEDGNGLLDAEELTRIVTAIFEVSVMHAPMLALVPESDLGLSELELQQYQHLLNSHKQEFVADHTALIVNKDKYVTKDLFVTIVLNGELKSLMWTAELRECVCRLYIGQENPMLQQ